VDDPVPLLILAAPSNPWVMKEDRGSPMSIGESNADTVDFACLDKSSASSTKTSGPSCGMSVMRPDRFLSRCFLNLLDQYLLKD
jgi:hypothetical protein